MFSTIVSVEYHYRAMRESAHHWTPVGETFNTRYYVAEEDIAIIMPQTGLKDDAASARINMEFQTNWAKVVRHALRGCRLPVPVAFAGRRCTAHLCSWHGSEALLCSRARRLQSDLSRNRQLFHWSDQTGRADSNRRHDRRRDRMVRESATTANDHMKIDTSAWTKFATTSNADFYEIEPHVLAVVPFDGTTDDAGPLRKAWRHSCNTCSLAGNAQALSS